MDIASNGVEDLLAKSFDQAQLKEDILKEKNEFETKIQLYKGNDPLDLRYKFINWINDKYPMTDRNSDRTSSSYLIKVLEETLTLFKDDSKYTQDSRYVGLLIKYAELQPKPLELFQDIYNQGRGTACAILYYAWASQYEKVKDFKMANEIYQLGINNKAEPLEDLRQVHMHMQLNVGRKVLGISEMLPTTPCREALRKLQIDNQQCQRTSRLKDESTDKLSSPRVPGRIGGKENTGTIPKKLKQPQEVGSDYKQQFKKHRLRVGEPDNFTCPIFIPEPDDPIKVKMYPKHEVYAIEGKEFQLEEIYVMQMRHEKLKQMRLGAANHTSDESAIVQEGINYSSLGAMPKKCRSDEQNSSCTTGYVLKFKKHKIRVGEPDNFKCPVFIPDEIDDPTKMRMYPRHEVYPVEGREFQLEELMAARYEQTARNRQCASESSNASSLVKTPNQNLGAGSNNSSNQGTPQALFGLDKIGSAGATGPGVGIPGLQDSIVHNQSLTVATKEALNLVQGMWNSPSPISALKSRPQQLTETFKVPQLPKSGFQLYTDEQSFRGPSPVVDEPERQLQKFGSSSKKLSVPTRNEKLLSDKKHKLKKKTTYSTVARRFVNDNEDGKGDLGVCQLNTDGDIHEKVEKVNDFPVATRPIMVYTDEVERVESCVTTYKNTNEFADETCNTQAFGFPTISSTPFINPTRNAMDTNTNQTDCDNENTVAYCLSVTTEKVSKANAPTDLSIILEASKERYSSSSGSSSSGQTPFGVGTRLLKTATEAFSDVKEENINDIEKRISSLNLGENIDPFSLDLLEKLLSHMKFPQKSHKIGYNVINTNAPILRENSSLTLGKEKYETEKELGKGSYARVLKATHKGKGVALKYQKPSFVWEYYITREIRNRIGKSDKMNGFLTVNNIYVFNNASILETELGRYGSLIDVINTNKLATGKPLKTTIATAMAIQLFSIVEHLHACKIIHGDIKPDNFIICSLPTNSLSELSIKLIDFGRSIDMTLLPEGTEFTTVVTTDGFQCNEMKENRPWTYQTDYYGLAGTAYCLLVGDYMKVIKRSGEWTLRTLLPRYMNREVWQPIFQRLLNIESCASLPELPVMRIALEDLLDSMGKAVFINFNSLSSVLNKC